MKKFYICIFFILFFNDLFAKITITDFNQNIKLNDFGKEVDIVIKVKIELDKNYFYKEWSYIFDKKQKIEVSSAKVVGKNYKTLFGNNELKFQFDNAVNGDLIEFHFKYIQFNDDKTKYSRQEQVYIPSFAYNSNAKIEVEVPSNFILYSLNEKFTQSGNIYRWNGKITKDGFSDIFMLTLRQAKWKADILATISGNENISRIDIITPLFFKNGNNLVEDYEIKTNFNNISKIQQKQKDIDIIIENINTNKIQFKVSAILKNDFDNKEWIRLDHNKYLDIDEKLARQLNEVIYQIQSLNYLDNTPLHIKLAKWVHNHIQYNLDYLGKNYSSMEIISNASGVCSHYSQLYNDLLRTAGIPSIIVSGISYDTEKNDFENHAWNLVYYNGEWLSIDPTWGLYSGIIPVSHIFLYLEERAILNYTLYGSSFDSFKSDIQKKITFLEN